MFSDVSGNMKQNDRPRECLCNSNSEGCSLSLMGREPPQNLLPSKHDFPRLVLVVALASLVAWTCNFLFTPSKPFCDPNLHSPDYFSGLSLSLSLSLFHSFASLISLTFFLCCECHAFDVTVLCVKSSGVVTYCSAMYCYNSTSHSTRSRLFN